MEAFIHSGDEADDDGEEDLSVSLRVEKMGQYVEDEFSVPDDAIVYKSV